MKSSENTLKVPLCDLYDTFRALTLRQLEAAILSAEDPDEKGFYRKLLNLKLQTEQEKIVGEQLV